MSPANDTWQTVGAAVYGAVGQDNFCAQAVNSTFDIAFVQHEPGPVCTTLQDKPFTGANGNYEECLRFYQKTYLYNVIAGTVTNAGMRALIAPVAGTTCWGPVSFSKPMARAPTVTLYNHATGTVNSVQDAGSVNHAGATAPAAAAGDSGFGYVNFTTATTAPMAVYMHYTSDTGW